MLTNVKTSVRTAGPQDRRNLANDPTIVGNDVPRDASTDDRDVTRQRVRDDDYDVIAFYDFSVEPSLLNRFYLSGAVNNWSGLSDPQLDQTLYEAMRQTDPAARATLYSAAQQRIMEQAVVLPIREYVNLVGVSSDLDGVVFSAQGWWPLLRNFQYSG